MTTTDPAIVLIVSAPLSGAYGTYAIMEAIASKNYMLGFVGSFMLVFAGLGIGKLVWGGDSMTATEELRLMLNESGVDWDYGITGATTTRFNANGVDLTFTPMRDGLVCSTILTPEQVIAAILGSCNCSNNCTNSERTETCRVEETERFECLDSRYKSFDYNPYITVHVMECSECGRTYEHVNGDYEFCPHCGRRIEVDG